MSREKSPHPAPAPSGRPKLGGVRRAVLDVARRRVAEGGLSALSARGLATEAGVSVGTLYNAFGDLDGVIRELNIATTRRLEAALSAAFDALPGDAGRTARLAALADAYLDFATEHTQLWNALFEFRPRDKADQRLPKLREALFEAMMARAAAPAAPGDLLALRMLWGAVHGVVALSVNQFLVGADRDAARAYLGRLVAMGAAAPEGR